MTTWSGIAHRLAASWSLFIAIGLVVIAAATEVIVNARAFLCAGMVAAALAAPARAADKPEDLAQAAAESWLRLTDAGDGAASWEQAAKVFKTAVTKEQWTQALAGVRPPLGKVVSRKLASRQYAEKVPGAPEGKYVILQYQTAFANKTSAVETITTMLDGGSGLRCRRVGRKGRADPDGALMNPIGGCHA